MTRSSSRWRFLNPMETLKAIYEALGSPHPKLSLIAVFIICGGLATGIWWFVGTQVAKDRAKTQPPQAPTSATASTSGAKSPAVTGNGNTIHYSNPPPPEKKKPKE
jgi:hypothetical protein